MEGDNMFYLKFKRFMDAIIAFFGIIILFPLYLISMLAIKIDSKGTILFKKKRIGKIDTFKYFPISLRA